MKIFNKNYLLNILWSGEYEDVFEISQSRWSSHKAMVFDFEGTYYMAEYSEGLSESQCEAPFEYSEDEIKCYEVCQIPILTKKWVTLDKVPNKLEKVKNRVERFLDRDDGRICDYILDEVKTIDDVIDLVNKEFNVDLKIQCTGGFDSTGYSVTCYAWAGIIDGQLYFDSFEEECY